LNFEEIHAGCFEEFEVFVNSGLALMVDIGKMHEKGRWNVAGWSLAVYQAE
jgi:hypothetical protein